MSWPRKERYYFPPRWAINAIIPQSKTTQMFPRIDNDAVALAWWMFLSVGGRNDPRTFSHRLHLCLRKPRVSSNPFHRMCLFSAVKNGSGFHPSACLHQRFLPYVRFIFNAKIIAGFRRRGSGMERRNCSPAGSNCLRLDVSMK